MTNNKKGPQLILEEKLGKLSIIRKVYLKKLEKISEIRKANPQKSGNPEAKSPFLTMLLGSFRQTSKGAYIYKIR